MTTLTRIAHCNGCNKDFDVTNMDFIDADEYPIVLDAQMKDSSNMQEAIRRVEANVEWDFEYTYKMFHYDGVPALSHEEVGTEGHDLVGLSGGHWSVL